MSLEACVQSFCRVSKSKWEQILCRGDPSKQRQVACCSARLCLLVYTVQPENEGAVPDGEERCVGAGFAKFAHQDSGLGSVLAACFKAKDLERVLRWG